MSLTSAQARRQYTVSTPGETLVVPFKFISATDLGVMKTVDAEDTPLVYNTDYTVTGGGAEPATGSITLAADAAEAGDVITIYRNADITQPSVYVPNDRFPAKTTETALDRNIMATQQLGLYVERALRMPISASANPELPDEAGRASKVLGFDASGNITVTDPSSAVFATGTVIEVASVSALKAVSVSGLTTGKQARISGFATSTDGGDGLYVYNSASSATENLGTIIAPNSGSGRWLRCFSGKVNVKWFGAKGDATTDDTEAFRAAIAVADAAAVAGSAATSSFGGYVFAPQGCFLASGTLAFPAGVGLCGAGRRTTQILFRADNSTDALTWNSATQYKYGGFLRDIDIACPDYAESRDIVHIENWADFCIENVRLNGAGRYGLYILDCLSCSYFNVQVGSSADKGLFIDKGASICTTQRFVGCYFNATVAGPNFEMTNGVSILLEGCTFESAGTGTGAGSYGIHLKAGECTLIQPHLENNADNDIYAGSVAAVTLSVVNGKSLVGPQSLTVASIALDRTNGAALIGGLWSARTKSLTVTGNTAGLGVAGGVYFPLPEAGGTLTALRQAGGTLLVQNPVSGNPLVTGNNEIQGFSVDLQQPTVGTKLFVRRRMLGAAATNNTIQEDWVFKDDAGNEEVYFRIEVTSTVITNGTEGAVVDFFIPVSGTLVRMFRMKYNEGVVFNAEQGNVCDLVVKGASVGDLFTADVSANALQVGGTGGKVGFFGINPIVRPLLATGAGATADNIITVLQNLGLVRQS